MLNKHEGWVINWLQASWHENERKEEEEEKKEIRVVMKMLLTTSKYSQATKNL